MNGRATASLRRFAAVVAALATLGCWNLPDLDDPLFASLLAGSRVWMHVSSVNPLPSSSEIEPDPTLLGTWIEVGEEPATWTFEAVTGESYRLEINAQGAVAVFGGTLHKVGRHVFLDLAVVPFPESAGGIETADGDGEWFHAFFKLIVEDDVARLEGIDEAWTREMIETGQLDIEYDPDSQYPILLTASDSEIAAFLERFADDPAVFGVACGFELRR